MKNENGSWWRTRTPCQLTPMHMLATTLWRCCQVEIAHNISPVVETCRDFQTALALPHIGGAYRADRGNDVSPVTSEAQCPLDCLLALCYNMWSTSCAISSEDRASASGAEGRWFESSMAHQET